MSDISIKFTWWELLVYSPIWGWPGLIIGGFTGALFLRKRPIGGAVLGALAGNFLWFAGVIFLHP